MSKKNKTTDRNILINKKAAFDYEFVEKIECGIVLEGTEVKSLREGRASFGSSYIKIQGKSNDTYGVYNSAIFLRRFCF